jgi:hypothetical protein
VRGAIGRSLPGKRVVAVLGDFFPCPRWLGTDQGATQTRAGLPARDTEALWIVAALFVGVAAYQVLTHPW